MDDSPDPPPIPRDLRNSTLPSFTPPSSARAPPPKAPPKKKASSAPASPPPPKPEVKKSKAVGHVIGGDDTKAAVGGKEAKANGTDRAKARIEKGDPKLDLASFREGLDSSYRMKKRQVTGDDRKPWGYWKDVTQIQESVRLPII